MADDPWAEFRQAASAAGGADQWADFRQKPQGRSVLGQLTGSDGGERFQTWPERAARGILNSAVSGASLPGDVMAGKASPDDTGRVLDLATMGAPVNPAIRAGDKAIPGVAKATGNLPAKVPTARELAAEGGSDIQAGRNSELIINPAAVADKSRSIQQGIGVHPLEGPVTFAKLKELELPPGEEGARTLFTPNDLQVLRESLQRTAGNFNPNAKQDQLAAVRAYKEFDKFLPNISPKDVLVRPAAGETAPATRDQIVAQALEAKREADRVAGLFERGRGNYAAAQRINDVTGELDRATTGLVERAQGRATAANSGRNFDNSLRSKAEATLEKPKEIAGLSDAEIAGYERIRDGGWYRNLNRNLGNRFGGGGGLGQTMLDLGVGGATAGTAASMTGSPTAAIISGILGTIAPMSLGSSARGMANRLARHDADALVETMGKRSPLYEERVANPETYVVSPEKRAAIAKLLLMQQMGQQQ